MRWPLTCRLWNTNQLSNLHLCAPATTWRSWHIAQFFLLLPSFSQKPFLLVFRHYETTLSPLAFLRVKNPLPMSIYFKEMKVYIHAQTCTETFLTALLIITKDLEQPRYPAMGGLLHKCNATIPRREVHPHPGERRTHTLEGGPPIPWR